MNFDDGQKNTIHSAAFNAPCDHPALALCYRQSYPVINFQALPCRPGRAGPQTNGEPIIDDSQNETPKSSNKENPTTSPNLDLLGLKLGRLF